MNWPLYRSFHARGLTQAKLAALSGINRSVLSRILTNENGRGKESRVKLFPHLVTAEIDVLGWREEYAAWWLKTTGNPLPPMEQSSTENNAPVENNQFVSLHSTAQSRYVARGGNVVSDSAASTPELEPGECNHSRQSAPACEMQSDSLPNVQTP